jgi:hypothetical protein
VNIEVGVPRVSEVKKAVRLRERFRRHLPRGIADLANVLGRPPVLRPLFQIQRSADRFWSTAHLSCRLFLPCGLHREAFAIRDSALRGWRPKACVHFSPASGFGVS